MQRMGEEEGLGFKREMENYLSRGSAGGRKKRPLLPMRVLGLLNQLKLIKRPDKEFRQGFTGAPAIAGREEEQLPLRRGELVPSVG